MATQKARLTVINHAAVAHCLDHPARGHRWPVRELAAVLGCAPQTLGHIRSGHRRQVDPELAQRIADAVGVHIAVLFRAGVSSESDDKAALV